MRLRQLLCVIAGLALLVGLLGCGASTQGSRSNLSRGADTRPSIGGGYGNAAHAKAAAQATVSEVDYFGWKAYKLTNGLVTVVAVPDIGGRIVEYKLGGHPFLWVNPNERGKLYPAPKKEADRKWHNFGGYKVWPAPQKEWGGPPDPLGSELDGGRWQGKVISKAGATVSIEMTSPPDPTVTGLQITRRVALFAGTTRVAVKETFRNVGKRDITTSIWDVTQVPGALESATTPSTEAKVYLPLNAKSKHQGGYFVMAGESSARAQWQKVAGGKVLETSYKGEEGKIGADSDGGWIAYVDDLHDLAFAKTFKVASGAAYPDNNSTVQVFTSRAATPYMEIEVLSPLKKLEPGEEFSFEESWYCAKVGGPIIKVTDAAAIRTHPTAAKKGKQVIISGQIGVFAPGQLSVEFLSKEGNKLGVSKPVAVAPTRPVVLRVRADILEGATQAMVVLSDPNGAKLGNVAQVPLSAKLAKAPSGKQG